MGRVRTVSCSFGRDRASQLTGNSKAGTLKAVVDNRSGDYSYFNSSSPLYGNLLPGRPVRLLASSDSLTDQPVWRGFLTKITPMVRAGGDSTVTLEATGPLGYVNLDQIDVPMVTSQRTDQVVDDILDAAGWPAGANYRTIATGKTTITRYWKSGAYTVAALQEVDAADQRQEALVKHGRQVPPPHTDLLGLGLDAIDERRRWARAVQRSCSEGGG